MENKNFDEQIREAIQNAKSNTPIEADKIWSNISKNIHAKKSRFWNSKFIKVAGVAGVIIAAFLLHFETKNNTIEIKTSIHKVKQENEIIDFDVNKSENNNDTDVSTKTEITKNKSEFTELTDTIFEELTPTIPTHKEEIIQEFEHIKDSVSQPNISVDSISTTTKIKIVTKKVIITDTTRNRKRIRRK